MSFDISLILDSLPKMLSGIGLTFQLLILSGVLGLFLAKNGISHYRRKFLYMYFVEHQY